MRTFSDCIVREERRGQLLDLVLGRAMFCVLALLLACLPAPAATAPPPPQKVLLLLPLESSRPTSTEILEGFEKALQKSRPTGVSVFVEFIQPPSGASSDYRELMVQYMSRKYGSEQFDVICPLRSEGFELAEKLRDRLWPSTPIVFAMLKNEFRPEFGPNAGTTGILLDPADEEAIRAALALVPGTRHIAVVTGASSANRIQSQQYVGIVHKIDPSLGVIELHGGSVSDMLARLSTLPEQTIIYLGLVPYDGAGRYLIETVLSERANSPMFSVNGHMLGLGIVGGPMVSASSAGEQLGAQVAKVLAGTPPKSLPVVNVPHIHAVDARQLERWQIPASRVPPGTEIMFREPSLWDRYRGTVVGVAAAIVLQALAIGFLLLERRRRFRSQRAALASEELSRAILSSLSARIAILNRAGVIIQVSENWGITDGAADLLPHANTGSNYLVSWRGWDKGVEAQQSVIDALEAVLEGREKTQVVDYAIHVGEQSYWMEVRAERLARPEGGAVVTHLDITPQKAAELERRHAIEELYHMNRVSTVGQLAGSLAHELAQPLASILINTQAAERFANRPEPDMPEIREALTQIAEDDRRARSIIDRMRAMLKKQVIPVAALDLNSSVQDVSLLIRNMLLVRQVQLRLDLSNEPLVVLGDNVSIQQVILNLVTNGMDAMQDLPPGARLLSVTTQGAGGSGEILIEDNGPGVAESIRQRLFDSFFTTKRDGLGMGLSICRSLVESQGGKISVENGDSGGARFRVSFPIAKSIEALASAVARPPEPRAAKV